MNELFSLTLYVFHKYSYSFNFKLSITVNKLPLENNPNIQALKGLFGSAYFIETIIFFLLKVL